MIMIMMIHQYWSGMILQIPGKDEASWRGW